MHWWDRQLEEYQALPRCKDFPAEWEKAIVQMGGRPADYPFWLLTARSMQYAWGANVGMQLIKEVADNVAGHRGVIINKAQAEKLQICEDDWVRIATPKGEVFTFRVAGQVNRDVHPEGVYLTKKGEPCVDLVISAPTEYGYTTACPNAGKAGSACEKRAKFHGHRSVNLTRLVSWLIAGEEQVVAERVLGC